MLFPKSALAGLALCLAAPLFAGPALTTIQDTIYRADGIPYNGMAMITWTPFAAGDTSNIATQSLTATITAGRLFVQLVPTTNATPAGFYSVTYTSAGNDQFTENWAVAPSNVPLRLADVRLSSSPVQASSSTLQESDVAGLVADLAIRPVKGAAYSAARVAFIDATGALNGVSGTASNCVHVDGSSGPCGSGAGAASPSFVDGEMLSGVVDGSNAVFTTAAAAAPVTSLAIYRNGILLKAGQDFTISGRSVQFLAGAIPQPGDTLLASYR